MTVVYAHSDSTLYAMDPHTNALRTVGTFGFPSDGNHHAITDIAIDADGDVVGVTVDAIYRINATSAACTLLSPLPGNHNFVGLTFLPVGGAQPCARGAGRRRHRRSYSAHDPDTGEFHAPRTIPGTWGLSGRHCVGAQRRDLRHRAPQLGQRIDHRLARHDQDRAPARCASSATPASHGSTASGTGAARSSGSRAMGRSSRSARPPGAAGWCRCPRCSSLRGGCHHRRPGRRPL